MPSDRCVVMNCIVQFMLVDLHPSIQDGYDLSDVESAYFLYFCEHNSWYPIKAMAIITNSESSSASPLHNDLVRILLLITYQKMF